MKKYVLALLLGALVAPVQAQSVLASWNFNTATISGTAATFGPISANVGTGSASGGHASSLTVWSSPAGNGSAKSFSSDHWAVGDYYQFSTSTVGVSGVSVAWDQTGSGTGPKDFTFQYSTNGSIFADFANYSVLLNGAPNTAWSATGSVNPAFSFSLDLSSITALNNQTTVYFRLTDRTTVSLNGGTVASGGTDRVDNFVVTVIPEPSTYALLIGAAAFGVIAVRRNRKSALKSA